MCGEMSVLETTLAGSSDEVWELAERRLAAARSREWHAPARLGPQARGDANNYLQKAEETLPAIRRSSPREALRFLRAPFQIGAAASWNTDASLGFSCMGY